MKIIMVWGQRICAYPGQFAPELLEAMSEYTDDDNPDVINEAYRDYSTSGEFTAVRIIEANISDDKLVEILSPAIVELENIREV